MTIDPKTAVRLIKLAWAIIKWFFAGTKIDTTPVLRKDNPDREQTIEDILRSENNQV